MKTSGKICSLYGLFSEIPGNSKAWTQEVLMDIDMIISKDWTQGAAMDLDMIISDAGNKEEFVKVYSIIDKDSFFFKNLFTA